MNRFVLSIFLALGFSGFTFGQNFFWSTTNFGEGAVNGDQTIVANIGDLVTVNLFYDAGETQNITEGIDLDFSWSNPGVAEFTAAETFDFDIKIASTPVGNRWGDFAGPAELVTGDSVTGFLAVNVVNGTGIQVANIPPGSPFNDEGYDQTANAFFVGSFDFELTSFGQTDLVIDNALVVDNGQSLSIPFNDFSIGFIPEPGSASILMLIMFSTIGGGRNRKFNW